MQFCCMHRPQVIPTVLEALALVNGHEVTIAGESVLFVFNVQARQEFAARNLAILHVVG